MDFQPALFLDGYKVGHYKQYPAGTSKVFSNLTARSSRIPGVDKSVFFGLQYFVKEYLINQWSNNFFNKPLKSVVDEYKNTIDSYLGEGAVTYGHIEKLHGLGALPLEIWALKEGSLVDIRVPSMIMLNTIDEYYWITNYLETILSCTVWSACNSATIASLFKAVLNKYADETVGNREHVQWQAHDFSMRGMSSFESACISGAAHLLSFKGSDTVPAIPFLKKYYRAKESKLIAASVAATEHAVMSAGTKTKEFETYKRLINEVYPKGIVSIVSDTYDYWNVLVNYLPKLKEDILKRPGKVVIRPDSGDPVKIICGDPAAPEGSPQRKGSVELLYEVFGGTKTRKGYKQLDEHIGLIYGDSITIERAKEICEKLKAKRFASNNIVFGVGSYTYQYNTRDTLGFAIKATYCEINGSPRNIFKDPATDDGTKKSAVGMVATYTKDDILAHGYKVKEKATFEDIGRCQFKQVFRNGDLLVDYSLDEVRENLDNHIN